MEIIIENLAKRFGRQWIFRNLNYTFSPKEKYAITGSNGSGKSTLLQVILAKIPYTNGELSFKTDDGKSINKDDAYKYFSIATTSMNLIDEFKLFEILKFHFKFRKSINGLSSNEILDILNLEKEKNKFIGNFSSGMKQRLKLGLAVLTDSDVVVLDEPGSNLDENAKKWYAELIKTYIGDRMLIVASNEIRDFEMCNKELNIESFKKT